jgi:hypothetical protein
MTWVIIQKYYCIMTSSIITIENYNKIFDAYPDELREFAKGNDIELPAITGNRGQALALMSQPEVRGQFYIDRKTAEIFFKNINMYSADVIQAFNKTTGIKRIDAKGKYCLKYPFEADKIDIDKRKDANISGDKNQYINAVKEWYKINVVDVPNEKWEIGHLDPTIGDSSEKNLAYQPPIQGRYRDRFKFCKSFIKMWPTAKELVSKNKIDDYYTNAEQRIIYEALKKKFETE